MSSYGRERERGRRVKSNKATKIEARGGLYTGPCCVNDAIVNC